MQGWLDIIKVLDIILHKSVKRESNIISANSEKLVIRGNTQS